jgi:2-methylcitrate synthase
MSESAAPAVTTPRPKKSVALSGVVAGNTALCTVGRAGTDLHYGRYVNLDSAGSSLFDEIAQCIHHGRFSSACLRARTRWT